LISQNKTFCLLWYNFNIRAAKYQIKKGNAMTKKIQIGDQEILLQVKTLINNYKDKKIPKQSFETLSQNYNAQVYDVDDVVINEINHMIREALKEEKPE